MRKYLHLGVAALLATGCSFLHSTTSRSTDAKTGIVTEVTSARAYTLFDANSSLTRFVNRSGYTSSSNFYAPGTYIANLNEQSSASNLVTILQAVAQGVAAGVTKP